MSYKMCGSRKIPIANVRFIVHQVIQRRFDTVFLLVTSDSSSNLIRLQSFYIQARAKPLGGGEQVAISSENFASLNNRLKNRLLFCEQWVYCFTGECRKFCHSCAHVRRYIKLALHTSISISYRQGIFALRT